MDKEQLKLHISSIQSEIDRIQALLSDYIGDIITVDPTTHELFKNSKEINEVGFLFIATYYEKEIKKLNSIYNQEILKTEKKVVKGRRSCDINVHKLTTRNNAKEILSQLLTHTTLSDDDQLLYDVLHELQDIESGWTKERVMTYVRNYHKKNNQIRT
ncbi:17383_t:CDS:2 [Dentiscutata erythropus]|uniref:17383_t:CDS:1 n=1 Tax=Dentiscutata erythropus TaxID=1348616 RepID=A0A9N9NRG7_9GLOM|nr:17383_t:CDS:2 [Dentiscutata erythropus]